jgi:ferrous iron transport protein B
MNSTKWFFTAIGYQCGFAYLIALIVFQLGSFAQTGSFGVGTAVALAIAAWLIYLLVRPSKYEGLDLGVSAVAARAAKTAA